MPVDVAQHRSYQKRSKIDYNAVVFLKVKLYLCGFLWLADDNKLKAYGS
jgi:hypothetical protein